LAPIPDGRVFGLDAQTLISIAVHLVNLAVLAFIMTRFLYRPVREFLYSRAHRIDEQLSRVKEGKAEADALKLEYEGMISNIGLERDKMLEEVRVKAEELRERALEEASLDIKHMKDRALEEIGEMKAMARDEMKRAVIEASSAMAEKIVSYVMDDEAYDHLFEKVISDLEDSSWWD